ncbi:hypothetical protein [Ramlibacter sp. AN1133]|uniref:hypothetical protein n=1 Tax=Ramlibacter sp. AN1133 TaxID=3133429 RepID=UPI0030C418E2
MTFFSLVLLLLLAVAVAVIWSLLRRRPAETPPPSPYARDDAFGRPDPAWGRGVPQQGGLPPPAGGLGGSVAGGLAAGLALGAGAVAAQEIGRRMFEHGPEGQGSHAADAPPAHHDQSHSELARDAGIGAFEPAQDPQGLADFGDPGWDDAGGGDDGGWEA